MTSFKQMPVFLHSYAKEDKFAERCCKVLHRMSHIGNKYSIKFRLLASKFSRRENEQRWLRQALVILAEELKSSDFVKWAMQDQSKKRVEQFCLDLVNMILNKIEDDSYVIVALHDDLVIGATLFRLVPFKGVHEKDIMYKYKIIERFMKITPGIAYPTKATEKFFNMIKCVDEIHTRVNKSTIDDEEPVYGIGRIIRQSYYADVIIHADYSEEIAEAYANKIEEQSKRPNLYRDVEKARKKKQTEPRVSDVIHDRNFEDVSQNLLFRVFLFTMDTLALDCTARTFLFTRKRRPSTSLEKATAKFGFKPVGEDKNIAFHGTNDLKCKLLIRVTDPRVPWDKMSLLKLEELSS